MAPSMRAKMRIIHISRGPSIPENIPTVETLTLSGVAKDGLYPPDGSDEDNTFAKYSPSVELKISITNPALIGKFSVGDTYYVDFTDVNVYR